jgi:hypothetical protein
MDNNKDKKPLHWFVRLFTLGERFDIEDFWDRLKKSVVQFILLVFGVTVSFGIEQQGGNSDDREDAIENLTNLRQEVDSILVYTNTYMEQIDWVSEMYLKQYVRWEDNNDSIFIDFIEDQEEPNGKYYFPPMGRYNQRDPFDPPRVSFDAIKLDGTFRLLPKAVGLQMTKIYDGSALKYLIENTGKVEERLVTQYIDRIASKWVYDLPWVDIDDPAFWIKNRKYVQQDKFVKYNLFKRVELWEYSIKDQLVDYKTSLEESIKLLDSVLAVRDSEIEFIWWVINPKD